MTKKRITVVGPPAFGYTKYITDALQKKNNVDAHLIYIDRSTFKYRNRAHRIKNFFYKTFLGINLKKIYQDRYVIEEIQKLEKQDIIFFIRPDMLKNKTLRKFRKYTKESYAFYYDSITRFPRKRKIIRYFDKIYSYDKEDIAKYNFESLTNYIYQESNIKNYDYSFFNISSHDFRFNNIERLAKYIKDKKWSYQIFVHHPNKDKEKSNYLDVINKVKSVSEMNDLMMKSKIVVEIQRNDQVGLSFRAFEAMGHRKKLITTNQDIVNYDFYNPNNILVLDEKNIEIPEDFVISPYEEIPAEILDKYKIDNWVTRVFNLQ